MRHARDGRKEPEVFDCLLKSLVDGQTSVHLRPLVQGFSNTRQSRPARTSSPGADSNMQMNRVTQT